MKRSEAERAMREAVQRRDTEAFQNASRTLMWYQLFEDGYTQGRIDQEGGRTRTATEAAEWYFSVKGEPRTLAGLHFETWPTIPAALLPGDDVWTEAEPRTPGEPE